MQDESGDHPPEEPTGGLSSGQPRGDPGVPDWAADPVGAERALMAALAAAEKEAAGQDAAAPASTRLAQALADLGCFYVSYGSPAVADRLLVRSLRLIEQGPPGRAATAARLCTRLAELRCRPRGFERSEAFARRAVKICRAHPGLGPAHPDTARALLALGHSLGGLKRLDEAEACLAEAFEVCKRAGSMPARTMWLLMTDLGDLARDRGRHEDAMRHYKASLQLREKTLKPGNPELWTGLNDLAAAHERLGGFVHARPLYERVLGELERRPGAGEDLVLAEAIHRVARTCAHDDPDRAKALLERVLAIEEKRLGPEHPALERTLRGLAGISNRQGRPEQAIRLRERLLAIREKTGGGDLQKMLQAVTELSHSHCLARQWGRAQELDERALYLAEKLRGFGHPTVARVLDHSARVLRELGKDSRAARLAARAKSIRAKCAPPKRDPPADSTPAG